MLFDRRRGRGCPSDRPQPPVLRTTATSQTDHDQPVGTIVRPSSLTDAGQQSPVLFGFQYRSLAAVHQSLKHHTPGRIWPGFAKPGRIWPSLAKPGYRAGPSQAGSTSDRQNRAGSNHAKRPFSDLGPQDLIARSTEPVSNSHCDVI